MTDFAISTTTKASITFSEVDLNGGTPGAGVTITELNWALLMRAMRSQMRGSVLSGFVLPTSGALTQDITLGDAVINGYLIRATGTVSLTLAANDGGGSAIWVYLALTFDATTGRANGLKLVTIVESSNLDPVLPANHIPLGRLRTDGSSIISGENYSSRGRISWGVYQRKNATRYRTYLAGSGDWYCNHDGAVKVKFPVPFSRTPFGVVWANGAPAAFVNLGTSEISMPTLASDDQTAWFMVME